MKKKSSMVKEVFIMLLLLILIMLILAVALYDFIPSNYSIPETITYSSDSTTTSIKQEIAYTNGGDLTADQSIDSELVTSLKSYSIDASDLAVYEQKNLYNSGNSNPFDYAEENTAPAADGTGTGTTSETSGTSAGSSTPGTFFEKPNSK